MTSLKRELPPLNALVTFEAAARLSSFTRASHELHVSQAAVSRQIARLEQQLGTRLFHRGHRRLELTGAGRRLQESVTSGLGEIASGVRRIRMSGDEPPVTLAATIAFANYWLMPRIHAFRAQHPEIDVRILAGDRELDPAADDVDIVVCYGEEQTPAGQRRTLLGAETVMPVCSPAYRAEHPELARAGPADLARQDLLHLDPEHWNRLLGVVIDWPAWFDYYDVTLEAGLRGLRMNNYPMLLEAVVAGRGIALGWRPVIDGLLAAGEIVPAIDALMHTPRGYYAAIATDRPLPPPARKVYRWLTGETARDS
ncbi:MAG: LysR substrate-binding domain-containing protein [Halofilum sp. (in: g-proteobacteria)]